MIHMTPDDDVRDDQHPEGQCNDVCPRCEDDGDAD